MYVCVCVCVCVYIYIYIYGYTYSDHTTGPERHLGFQEVEVP